MLQLHGGPLRGPRSYRPVAAAVAPVAFIGRRLAIARRLPLSDFIPTIAEIPRRPSIPIIDYA